MYNYEVNLEWNHDRKGTVSSPVLPQMIEVATPPEFYKGMPDIWSPEHLLVAAVSSCLMTTFLGVSEKLKLEFQSYSCNAVGKFDMVDGKLMMSEITLMPQVVVDAPELEPRALRALEISDKACLISNSIRAVVHLKPTILVTETV